MALRSIVGSAGRCPRHRGQRGELQLVLAQRGGEVSELLRVATGEPPPGAGDVLPHAVEQRLF
jgi:hypothetical protein